MDDARAEMVDRLERRARRWRAVGLLAAAVAIAGWVVAAGARSGRALEDGPASPRELVEEQLKLSRLALRTIERAARVGVPARDQAQEESTWALRVLGSEIFLSLGDDEPRTMDPEVYLALPAIAPKPGREAAFEAYYRRMRAWEDRLRDVVTRGGMSPLEFTYAQERRLRAEIWLARERARASARRTGR